MYAGDMEYGTSHGEWIEQVETLYKIDEGEEFYRHPTFQQSSDRLRKKFLVIALTYLQALVQECVNACVISRKKVEGDYLLVQTLERMLQCLEFFYKAPLCGEDVNYEWLDTLVAASHTVRLL